MKSVVSTLLTVLPLALAHAGPSGGHHNGGWNGGGGWYSGGWNGGGSTGASSNGEGSNNGGSSNGGSNGGNQGSGGNSQSCTSLTTDEIRASGNNSLFTRWRPYSHVNAPAGWLNDPCAPMYDPTRDEYHIFYQWHPQHINWGNISWGHATSKDMISWTDHGGWQDHQALALGPSGNGSYNGLGIFSGTGQPVNIHGQKDGTLLLFYTSVSWLPIGWSIPYHPGSETQSLAYSTDGGNTWQEYAGNPVISATTETAPMYWNITGFRDPFFEPSPHLDALLGQSEPHYYAVFGSGIKGVGPRIPLWSAPASDLTDWTFLGALWEPQANTSFGPLLSTGTYAFNFEVSGFFSLTDSKGDVHFYANMGTEGGNVSFHESNHWALWNEGVVTRGSNGSAQFHPVAGGAGDWGNGYAITSFNDTKNNRRIQWVWAPEDLVGDGGLFSAKQQGFQGSLTIPRELFVHEADGLLNPNGTLENGNSVVTQHSDGTYSASTLGVMPARDVADGLRLGAKYTKISKTTYTSNQILQKQSAASYEVRAVVSAATGPVGLVIGASPDGVEYTNVIYEPSNNTILVERLHSSTIVEFANVTVTGFFAPYILAETGKAEAITMDVFVDGSLVEVFVNERFALSTRIYPSKLCSTGFGVYVGAGSSATFSNFEAWVGLANVWPERPANSSSPLVWDTAAATNNYTWWSGN
ncbi:hypothetical protein B0A48_12682 [Cryoendolithus antarcticus]|uniref:Glycoside hydrolase family 32 protein n=1 Tax=Cryoendolithus antarcticus TaxID=1507870 RepID=A0A1V8SR57_9PEZI|nr:hypothetical protein B0A48_12682 [Cryoendolithus antarcticus]